MINKIFNKQSIMILLDRVIGQAKTLFNYISKKTPEEIIPEGMLGISIHNNIIVIVHLILTSLENIELKSFGVFKIESSNLIQNTIAKYINDYNLAKIESCYVLTPEQYVLALIEATTDDQQVREKAILWGIKDYINYSINDALLDYFEVPIERARDNAKLAYAVAMRAKLSEEIGELINTAGANLKYIDIRELCLINIMALYITQKSNADGYLLLYFSEDTANFLLIKDHALFITRSTKLNLAQLDNFDAKVNIDDDKFKVADRLLLEMQRSLDYSNNLFKEVKFNAIYIMPCVINIDLFIPWVQEQIGLPVNIINLSEKIKFPAEITTKEQAICLIAIGAAMRKVGGFFDVSTC